MAVAFNITSLVDFVQTHLVIRIGEIYFDALDICILVLALSAAALSSLNLWWIGEREDREKRLFRLMRGGRFRRGEPEQTRRPPWFQWLGTRVASTKIIGIAEQESLLAALTAAGIRGHGHLAALITSKVCCSTAFIPLCWLLLEWCRLFVWVPTLRFAILAGAVIVGWRFPEVVLSRLATWRRRRLEKGLPDALDLLVICAEAGLSLHHAIEQVGDVLYPSNPEVAKEFAATAVEMRVLPVRGEALENLAQRVGLASLRSIVVTLDQSINFGTPLAESLRVLAGEMRNERLARFEERAARLPVLLTLPLMVFILPSLMVVIGTPLVLRIVDMLGMAP
jgi:tight adherence protein C